jgi:hypothetical protein
MTRVAVTRNGVTGRVISKTSRGQQAALPGIEGATVHRADLLDVLAAAVSAGAVPAGVVPAGVVSLGQRCGSVDADGQWLGPHGTIVLYPLRGEELINVVCHYDDRYRHESWVARCPREEVLQRYAGWHKSLLRLFAAGDTWYKWAPYDRDPIPAWTRGGCRCSATRRTRCCPTRGRAPARRSRTGLSNHLASPLAARRRDLVIAVRKRLNRRDADGRGAAWLAAYDATAPDVLAP